MVQVAKSTQDFELFLRRNPGTVRVSTENSKAAVILARCAVFGPATAEFRFRYASAAPSQRKRVLEVIRSRLKRVLGG